MRTAIVLLLITPLAACGRTTTSSPAAASTTTPPAGTTPTMTGKAAVGQPALDFTLKDLDGKTHRLSDYKGKTIVLEWFNPQCPFVNLSHTKGSLKGTAKRITDKGVVWLAINSAAPG